MWGTIREHHGLSRVWATIREPHGWSRGWGTIREPHGWSRCGVLLENHTDGVGVGYY